MNKYEKSADRNRESSLRSSVFFGMAGVALVVILLVVIGRSSSAPSGFWSKVVIVVAVVLLLLRQIQRQLRRKGKGTGKKPRAAEPDPLSRLHLDD